MLDAYSRHHFLETEDTEPTAPGWLCLFLCIWICGTIVFGKSFCYIRVGPVYITECIIALLILSNAKRLEALDFLLCGIVGFYIFGGVSKWGTFKFLFVVKDITFLYYILFLRFFPRNFPSRYLLPILIASVICILEGFTMRLSADVGEKYKYAIVLMFFYNYFIIKDNDRISVPLYFVALFSAIASNFKTLMIVALIYPLLFKNAKRIERFLKFRVLLAVAISVFIIVRTDLAKDILYSVVGFLNNMMETIGSTKRFHYATSAWRADIWQGALRVLFNHGDYMFGEFPGHNFMDSKYLGLKFFLRGGDLLGIVRSGHNIVVQTIMKTGILGCSLFLYYLTRWGKAWFKGPLAVMFAAVLLMALTADILEVPSRGALFYCLVALLGVLRKRRDGEEVMPEQAKALETLEHLSNAS